MIYPVTDYFNSGHPSYTENEKGYGLTAPGMRWFWTHYLNRESEADNPFVSPLRASDLRGLPPALIITAEYDILRDEGERYGERLAEGKAGAGRVRNLAQRAVRLSGRAELS